MIEKLSELTLCWIATRRRPPRASDLRKALFGAVAHRISRAEWPALMAQVLERLRELKQIEAPLRLTPEGTRALCEKLGLQTLPPGVRFAQMRSALVARSQRAAGSSVGDLRAAALQRGLGLRLSGPARMPAVRNAMAWKALGRDDDAPFTREAVIAWALEQKLGPIRVKSSEKGLALLAAKFAGASRTTAESLRQAALRSWLEGSPPAELELRLEDFARHVVRIAEQTKTGRYGDHLVFISHVFNAAGRTSDERDFKRKLGEAHQAGLLKLTRADLVEAMDPADVAASATAVHGATFHFVRI